MRAGAEHDRADRLPRRPGARRGWADRARQAVIGDIVSPRERGRYQGLFGAVFGVASVAGPLLGGVIVTAVSWRWIFYVNLPVGLLALTVLGVTLRPRRPRATVDRLPRSGLLAAA